MLETAIAREIIWSQTCLISMQAAPEEGENKCREIARNYAELSVHYNKVGPIMQVGVLTSLHTIVRPMADGDTIYVSRGSFTSEQV